MPEINSPLEEARALIATWRARHPHQMRVHDADVPAIVHLLGLQRASGLGQRDFCASVRLSISTFGAWRTGQRKYGSHWPLLAITLDRPVWVKPSLLTSRHAVVCRRYRVNKKARTLAQAERVEEVINVAA